MEVAAPLSTGAERFDWFAFLAFDTARVEAFWRNEPERWWCGAFWRNEPERGGAGWFGGTNPSGGWWDGSERAEESVTLRRHARA